MDDRRIKEQGGKRKYKWMVEEYKTKEEGEIKNGWWKNKRAGKKGNIKWMIEI